MAMPLLESLKCEVCTGMIAEPYMVECGHSFCYRCIKTWILSNPVNSVLTCTSCRTSITREPIPNHQLRLIVTQYVDNLPDTHNDKEFYKHRLQEAKGALEKDRRENSLFMGEFTNTQATGPVSAATAPESGQQGDPAAQTSAHPSTARPLIFTEVDLCPTCGEGMYCGICEDCEYEP